MVTIDIAQLVQLLKVKIPSEALVKVDVSPHENGGVHLTVDGAACANNIAVWPNGYCDIEYVSTSTGECRVSHHEFTSLSQAATQVLAELHDAIQRSGTAHGV